MAVILWNSTDKGKKIEANKPIDFRHTRQYLIFFPLIFRSAIDRLVEDLIQESMAKGEFNNLKGMGKPLKTSSDYNPMIDSTTHNLNKIMIEQGYAPEWVMLDREIKWVLVWYLKIIYWGTVLVRFSGLSPPLVHSQGLRPVTKRQIKLPFTFRTSELPFTVMYEG